MNNVLTSEEEGLIRAMHAQWAAYLSRNQNLSNHYNGLVPVQDIGISVPPPIVNKLKRCSMMWSRQAVKRIADGSILEGYNFETNEPSGFQYVWDANDVINKYDETLPSQLQHGPSFWTVTAGAQGEPESIISSYDAMHATALWDYRHNRILCGLAIVDVDPENRDQPTAVNFYAPDGSIVEIEQGNGKWLMRRLRSDVGRCCMEVMRNEPDKMHPFGKSVITPAILSLEEEANREAIRMVLHAELYTSPTRWVMGADDEMFDEKAWEQYLGSVFVVPQPDGNGTPTTGTYSQGTMEPHIAYIRQLANQFAAEASIPIHSLLYTEANPASAEAIEASRHDLVERVQKVNRLNGASLRNISLIALSLLEKKPFAELSENTRSFSAQFRNPLMPTLAASADAAQKLGASVPGFAGTPTYWRMLGYNDRQIADINAEIAANINELSLIASAGLGSDNGVAS